MYSRFLLAHSCRNGCDSPHDSDHDWTKNRDSEMWMSAPLSCSACVKKTHLKLQDGNSILPKEQSHSSCCMSLHAFSLRQWRAQKATVVTQARVSLELSICSCSFQRVFFQRRDALCPLSVDHPRSMSSPRLWKPRLCCQAHSSLSTRDLAMCLSSARCFTLGHESPDMQRPVENWMSGLSHA